VLGGGGSGAGIACCGAALQASGAVPACKVLLLAGGAKAAALWLAAPVPKSHSWACPQQQAAAPPEPATAPLLGGGLPLQ